MDNYPACIRCGMCCIAAPCVFSEPSENFHCIYFTVNEDDTTTCENMFAKKLFVDSGIGCLFQRPEAKEVYDLHIEIYNVNQVKRKLKRRCSYA